MTDDPLSRAVPVTEPDAAAVFADPKQVRLLMAFTLGPRGLADAAREAEMPLNLAHYHLGRLVRHRLVRTAGTRARAGRPVRLYRAAGDAFFVAFAAMKRTPADTMLERLGEALRQARSRDTGGGVLCLRTPEGRIQMRSVRRGTASGSALDVGMALRLDAATARALGQELAAVVRRYAERPTKGRTLYLVHAAVVPRRED